MTRTLPIALAWILAASAACSQTDTADADAGNPDGAVPDGAPVDAESCEQRTCTLREAAARAGISIGVHIEKWEQDALPIAAREFDRLSVHGITIKAMQPERGVWRYDTADRHYELAADNGMTTHGFHWLWSQELLDSNPAWFNEIDDREELWQVLEEHLRKVVERYPELGRINVVNEPFDYGSGAVTENLFHRVLGEDYIAEAFRRAHALAPGYELFINENLVEYFPDKAEALLSLVRSLVDRGVPIDGVGLQSHLFSGEPDWELLEEILRRVGDMGLGAAMTELDAPVEPDLPGRLGVQADRYAGMVERCLRAPACDAVMIWGVHDGSTWVDWFLGPGMDPLLYTADLEPKPAYRAVLDTLVKAGSAAR
jgi:endo-1,4-beta-xylanase